MVDGIVHQILEDGNVLERKENEFNFGFEVFVLPGISICKIIRLLLLPAYICDSFSTSPLIVDLYMLLCLLQRRLKTKRICTAIIFLSSWV